MLFGPELDCLVTCPNCGERLEHRLGIGDVLSALPDEAASESTAEIKEAGWHVRFRLLDTEDLMQAVPTNDARAARRALLRRCVLASAGPGGPEVEGLPEAGLPQVVEQALVGEMGRLEEAANIAFDFACPVCAHVWTAPWDILGFLWEEIEGWAYRTLREVHLLASTYGWGEAEILRLSPLGTGKPDA